MKLLRVFNDIVKTSKINLKKLIAITKDESKEVFISLGLNQSIIVMSIGEEPVNDRMIKQ